MQGPPFLVLQLSTPVGSVEAASLGECELEEVGLEVQDLAAAVLEREDILLWEYHIVYNETWGVPALYFNSSRHRGGAPLVWDEIQKELSARGGFETEEDKTMESVDLRLLLGFEQLYLR